MKVISVISGFCAIAAVALLSLPSLAEAMNHNHHAHVKRTAVYTMGNHQLESIPHTANKATASHRHAAKHKCDMKYGICSCPDGACLMSGGCSGQVCSPPAEDKLKQTSTPKSASITQIAPAIYYVSHLLWSADHIAPQSYKKVPFPPPRS